MNETLNPVACLLLCAGKSSRMGAQNKLLANLNGQPLIKKTLSEIHRAKFSQILLITGHEHEKIQAEVSGTQVIRNAHYAQGMHSSIRCGLETLKQTEGFIAVCLGDQPLLTHEDYDRLILHATLPHKLIYPSFEGKRGNPVLISLTLKQEILDHEDDDKGCAYLFKRYPEATLEVKMPTNACLVDVDTPEALQQILQMRT